MSSRFVSPTPDMDKTREQLLAELQELRARIATVEPSNIRAEQPENVVKTDEEMTRQLLEQTLYGVWVNVGGKVAYINEVGAGILGASNPGEVVGKSLLDIIHPDYRDLVGDRIKAMTSGDSTVPMIEEKYLRVDGTAVDVDVWAMRFIYEGEPAILVAFKDITERKRAEEELKLTQFALDNFRDSAIWITLDGHIVYVNQEACRSLGYSREELLSMHIWAVDPDYSQDRFRGLWRETYQQGYAVKFESTHVTRDGRAFPVEVTSCYTRYGDKEYLITFDQDITERKRAEKAIRESEAKYRDLVENANSIIIRWDLKGNLTFFNEFAEEFFGYKASEVIGKNTMDTIVPAAESTGRDLAAMIRDIERHPELYKTNINENIRRNGERVWISWTNKAIQDPQGNVVEILSVGNDITERKRAEEAVASEKRRLFSLLNELPGFVYLQDTGYRVHYANRRFKELFGDPENAENVHCYEIFYGRSEPCEECPTLRALGANIPFEWEWTSPAGRTYHLYDYPFREKDGTPMVLELGIDITEHKHIEKALVKDRYILTKSQEVAHLGNWAWNLETGEFTGSTENYRIYGYGPDEVKPTPGWVLSRVHPEDRTGLADFMEANARDGKPGSIDFRVIRPDGSVRYVNTIVDKAVRDKAGKITRLYGISQDVTERKRVEEALRLDEVRLEALVEMNEMAVSSPIDIIRSGLDKGVKLTGSSMGFFNIMAPDEKRVDVYVDSGNVMGMTGMWPRSLSIENGGLWTSVYKSRKPLVVNDYSKAHPHKKGIPQGHEPLTRLMGVPVFEGDRIVAVFMVANKDSDYTDADLRQLGLLGNGIWRTYARMLAEEALKAAKAQAELYVDLMGHDINNMHQVALGYLELARDLPEGADQGEYLDKSMEVLKRSTKLIGNVRKLQKLRDGVFEVRDVNVCGMLADVQSEYKAVSGKTIVLNTNGHDHCSVRANELLHDVFSNLVNNAIKHTSNGTKIAIDLDMVEDNGQRYCRVAVEDNGPGIPDGSKEQIFNRMSKGTARGMGLGLYLVRTLVDSYNGRVWVEDRVPGDHTRGARFVVMLPAVDK